MLHTLYNKYTRPHNKYEYHTNQNPATYFLSVPAGNPA